MEKNLHNDKLEAFFRKSLAEMGDEPSADGWDVPSDKSWDKIAEALPPGRGALAFLSWKIGLISLAALLVATGIFYLVHQNRQLTDKVAKQAFVIENLQEKIKKETRDKKESTIETLVQEINESIATTEKSFTGAKNEKPEIAGMQNENNEATILLKEEPTKTDASSRPIFPGKAVFSLLPSRAIQPLNHTYDWLGEMEKMVALSVQQPGKPIKYPRFFIAPYYSFGRSFTSTTSSVPGASLLFRTHEKTDWSGELGIKFGGMLSRKWSLESGIGSYTLTQHSAQRYRVNHEPLRARSSGPNHFEITYALAVPSSFGTSDVEVDLRYSSNENIADNEEIMLNVITRQQVKFLSIPIKAGYHLNAGKFGFSLKAGLSANFLNARTLNSTVNALRPGMYSKKVRLTRRFDEVNSFSMDYLLSAGVQYHFSDKLRFSVEPSFRRNIKAITSTEDYDTKAYKFSTDFGVYWYF